MQSMKQVIEAHGIEADVAWADENPNMSDPMPGSSHYLVTLKSEHGEMEVFFTQGPALTEEPTVEVVLDCLASDASLAEQHDDGIRMAVELGETIETSEDVERAEKTYRTIQEQRKALERLLGGSKAVERLLYETERP